MASQPDHAGLEVVHGDQHAYAPEVAATGAPETVKRTPSTSRPEVWQAAPQQQYYDQPNTGAHQQEVQGWSSKENDDVRAYYEPKPPAYMEPSEKRILGMRRKIFFIVLGIVVLCIVILAAVLGGVLGSRSSSSSKDDSSPSTGALVRTQKNSGLAVVLPAGTTGSDGVYTYYLASNGSIVESFSPSASQLNSSSTSRIIVESGALPGSPIAAISRQFQTATFRHIFYFDPAGNLLTTNASDSGNRTWHQPYNILTRDTANTDSPALAACAGTEDLNGIRVYYGSKSNYIQEVGTDFTTANTVWNMWYPFKPYSDATTGVACTINNGVNHVYLRNTSSQSIQQWTWDYGSNGSNGGWKKGATGPNNLTAGGDMTAAFDGTSTDHIFYQADGGQIQRALFVNDGYSGYETLNTSAPGTRLSAAYVTGSAVGAILAYQDASTDNAMVRTNTINFDGRIVASGLLA